MAWTEKELKIFASGLAIGGQWNHVGDSAIPIPNIDPLPGRYSGQLVYVRLWSDVPGAVVRATFDGSDPTATAEPISPNTLTEIDVTTTVKAYAQVNNRTSKIATYVYNLDNPFDWHDTVIVSQGLVRVTDLSVADTLHAAGAGVDVILDAYLPVVNESAEIFVTKGG